MKKTLQIIPYKDGFIAVDGYIVLEVGEWYYNSRLLLVTRKWEEGVSCEVIAATSNLKLPLPVLNIPQQDDEVDFEKVLKDHVFEAFKEDGQSEKAADIGWKIWWGMNTIFKKAVKKAFKAAQSKGCFTTEQVMKAIDLARKSYPDNSPEYDDEEIIKSISKVPTGCVVDYREENDTWNKGADNLGKRQPFPHAGYPIKDNHLVIDNFIY